jgi:uncharacterized membrane protein YhaH (DUF805 family)
MVWYFADYHINSPILALAVLALGALPVILSIVAMLRIVQRAGFSGWWTLLILVPVVNTQQGLQDNTVDRCDLARVSTTTSTDGGTRP